MQDHVEHTVFSVEQAKGSVLAAGTRRRPDDLAYLRLSMAMEHQNFHANDASENSTPPGSYVAWTISLAELASDDRRLRIEPPGGGVVQWDEPISPDENARDSGSDYNLSLESMFTGWAEATSAKTWAADVTCLLLFTILGRKRYLEEAS